MKKNIQILINDLKKTIEMDKIGETLITKKKNTNTHELITYAINFGIINSTADILEIVKELPEISELISTEYDKKIEKNKKKSEKNKSSFYNHLNYRCGICISTRC